MSRKRSVRAKRDSSHITSSLLRPDVTSIHDPFASLFHVEQEPGLDDLRVWRPERRPWPVKTLFGLPVRQRALAAPAPLHRVVLSTPQAVPMCVRRAQRKEVLHALRRTGKGTGGGKHRFTANSKVKCR